MAGRALGQQAMVAAPGEVDAVRDAALEPEAGRARRQQQCRIRARASAPALAQMRAVREGVTLRRAFAQVVAGRVEQLVGVVRQREGGEHTVEQVVVVAGVGDGDPLPQQPRRRDLELDRRREREVLVDETDEPSRRRRRARVAQGQPRREPAARASSADPRSAEPAVAGLGQQRQQSRVIEPAGTARRPDRARHPQRVGAELAEIGAPVHDHGNRGRVEVDDDRGSAAAQVHDAVALGLDRG